VPHSVFTHRMWGNKCTRSQLLKAVVKQQVKYKHLHIIPYHHQQHQHPHQYIIITITAFCNSMHLYNVSKKNPPTPDFFLIFFRNGWEFFVQILHTYYTFLSMLEYKVLSSYLQLWQSYAILSAITIICSKCPLSVETHAEWSHLIWHNFVTFGDNWIKFCSLA